MKSKPRYRSLVYSNFGLLLLLFFSCQEAALIQIENSKLPKLYEAVFTSQSPQIDGQIDSLWASGNWSDSFVDIEGVLTPKNKTRFKMMWDNHALYILAQLEEPHIWGTLQQRDTVIFYNNDFEVFIDPDGDTHDYMELEINALNTAWDLFLNKPYLNKNKVDNQWNIEGLQSAVFYKGSLNDPSDVDEGWTLEMALPWKSLSRGSKQETAPINQFWRLNFSRVNWDFSINKGKYSRKKDPKGAYLPEYNWVWSPQGLINMHLPEHWGYVYFSDKKGKQIDYPEEAALVQWMYAQYREKAASEKKGQMLEKKPVALWKGEKIFLEKRVLEDTVYYVSDNPHNQKTYRIRSDGKLDVRSR